jgi:exodeoxyribonuclease V alpha subunit
MNDSSPQPRTPSEEIAGLVERVTFFNADSGFAILRVKVRGQRDLVTVLGSLPSVSAGEWLTAKGWWVRDKEHGLQFKAQVLKAVPPTTSEGVERYLAGGFVKGVGPVLAKKLVGHFGAEVLAVISDNPADLESVDGIGPKRRERIATAWQEGMQIREIMLFLHSHGDGSPWSWEGCRRPRRFANGVRGVPLANCDLLLAGGALICLERDRPLLPRLGGTS